MAQTVQTNAQPTSGVCTTQPLYLLLWTLLINDQILNPPAWLPILKHSSISCCPQVFLTILCNLVSFLVLFYLYHLQKFQVCPLRYYAVTWNAENSSIIVLFDFICSVPIFSLPVTLTHRCYFSVTYIKLQKLQPHIILHLSTTY